MKVHNTMTGRMTLATVLALSVGVWFTQSGWRTVAEPPIKVGILHSMTGTMAISERAVVDSVLLAVDELNESGGLLGRQIEPTLFDGKSDWPTFAQEAENLILTEEVSVVFGCWTSASRKSVKPVFEKYDHLLFYPVQYEGLEASPNIVYTGAAPNQQIIPAVRWSLDNFGKRFFLVGSDYVFPRTANAIIRDYTTALGAEIVGEEYLLLGSNDVDAIIRKIVEIKPDVILNTINGDSNIAFFEKLKAAGVTPDEVPVMSFSISENELDSLGIENMIGHYACWNYFQSLDNAMNNRFVSSFKKKYGNDRLVNDPMEAAYIAVHLWAQAVLEAETENVNEVRRALGNQSFDAPGGLVYVDPTNHHIWKTVRIGEIKGGGQFEIVWDSEKPIQPVPFPGTRTESDWNEFLAGLYDGWDQAWANSGQ